MQDMIQQLCREYTDLSDEEIKVIQTMALTLQPLANLEAADMFIDCPCVERDSIVVAEAKPEEVPSSYNGSVVGMLAKEENEPAVARTVKMGVATRHMRARTQEDNYTIQCVEPIWLNSRVIGVLIRERRITEDNEEAPEDCYRAVETPLAHMINEKEWLAENIDDGLLLVDKDGYVSFRNIHAREIFHQLGYVNDILGQKYKNICLTPYDEDEELDETLQEVRVGNYYLRIRQTCVNEQDVHMVVVVRDITWMRKQEQDLLMKTISIKELHHRIKNNLQTIASLLRLQARRSDSEETKKLLYESISRILSISATHQLLAGSGMDRVSLKDVLDLVKGYAVQQSDKQDLKVSLTITGDDIMVDSKIATSIALVVNEILQNSMKYAFVGRKQGNIEIAIEKGKVYSKIIISDDGVGFADSEMKDALDREQNKSLGLNIVKSIVREKLYGTLMIHTGESGTKTSFDFVNEESDFVFMSGVDR